MSQIAPFHSIQELVYHTQSDCPQAQRISPLQQRAGMGGKVDCLCCRHLTKQQIKETQSMNAVALKSKVRSSLRMA